VEEAKALADLQVAKAAVDGERKAVEDGRGTAARPGRGHADDASEPDGGFTSPNDENVPISRASAEY
jgi:hypothetical protein